MTVGYVDTSCLVAVAFTEPGYEQLLARLREYDALFTSALAEAELRSAFSRQGVADGTSVALRAIGLVLPDRPLSAEIGTVIAAGHLRGADLWHVACALFLSPEPAELAFLSLDRSQSMVATDVGFQVPDLAR